MKYRFLIVLVLLSLCACSTKESGQVAQNVQSQVTTTPPPQQTVSKNIPVMTYDVLNGAGVLPDFEPFAAESGYPGSRLQQVLGIIKEVDPDILGIEEAAGWDWEENLPEGMTQPVAETVAEELNMNYCLGTCVYSECGYNDVVLYTKYQIVESEDYKEVFTRAALRAKLVTPEGYEINVFIVHLIPEEQLSEWIPQRFKGIPSEEIREQEINYLADLVGPYMDEAVIVMGDMNSSGSDPTTDPSMKALSDIGLSPNIYYGVDQIWTSSLFRENSDKNYETEMRKRYTDLLKKDSDLYSASDHLPVFGDIDLIG